jgi:hypothetical protein
MNKNKGTSRSMAFAFAFAFALAFALDFAFANTGRTTNRAVARPLFFCKGRDASYQYWYSASFAFVCAVRYMIYIRRSAPDRVRGAGTQTWSAVVPVLVIR